ncbi:hypothetical protein [Gemmata sp.]|uniref:hypothetical protein n=1 Tax=Gemmata sp. TaxID=1914242 RepID=UPI003F703972
MNATEVEAVDGYSHEEKVRAAEALARSVCALLKEYADKLAALNADLLDALYNLHHEDTVRRAAWLIDRGELLRRPLTKVMSSGTFLAEHSALDATGKDEVNLRMREIEIHLHHALRLTNELRKAVEQERTLGEQVAKLRMAAGLSGARGGPLNPD